MKDKGNYFSIGDVSKISGVHIKSLRYYDEIGVLRPAYVDPDTNYRYYTFQQIGVLDAIKACIELDISLKDFAKFTDNDGNIVHYSRMLEYGKKMATEKMRSIRANIKKIEVFQQEVERRQKMQNQNSQIIIDALQRKCFAKRIKGEIDETRYYDEFQVLLQEAAEAGFKTGYDLGKMFVYEGNSVKKYNYVTLSSLPRGKHENVIVIPAGQYLTKCIQQTRIQQAEDEFPDLFRTDYRRIVIERELFTGAYNTTNIEYELSCLLPVGESSK